MSSPLGFMMTMYGTIGAGMDLPQYRSSHIPSRASHRWRYKKGKGRPRTRKQARKRKKLKHTRRGRLASL